MVDQTVLSSKGKAKEALIGTVSAGPQADAWDDPRWQAFVKAYLDAWPPEKRFAGPSLCATNYYDETTAALLALDKINGDLSDGHKKFREALATLVLDAPNGQMKLDSNHQAIGTSFVTEAVKDKNGDLVSKVVQVVPNVNQTLGLDPAAFARIGLPGREVPVCKRTTINLLAIARFSAALMCGRASNALDGQRAPVRKCRSDQPAREGECRPGYESKVQRSSRWIQRSGSSRPATS
jgi:hypothetical protein